MTNQTNQTNKYELYHVELNSDEEYRAAMRRVDELFEVVQSTNGKEYEELIALINAVQEYERAQECRASSAKG